MELYKIVDAQGVTVQAGLQTRSMADELLTALVVSGRMGCKVEKVIAPPAVPLIAPPEFSPPLHRSAPAELNIEKGQERAVLSSAIQERSEAAARLEAAQQAVDRAKAFRESQKVAYTDATARHAAAIEASSTGLADALRAGEAVGACTGVVDTPSTANEETTLKASEAALKRLEVERDAAEVVCKDADDRVQAVVYAVAAADADQMLGELEQLQTRVRYLKAAIEAAGFHMIPLDAIRVQLAMEGVTHDPSLAQSDDAHAQWFQYLQALRNDAGAQWEVK